MGFNRLEERRRQGVVRRQCVRRQQLNCTGTGNCMRRCCDSLPPSHRTYGRCLPDCTFSSKACRAVLQHACLFKVGCFTPTHDPPFRVTDHSCFTPTQVTITQHMDDLVGRVCRVALSGSHTPEGIQYVPAEKFKPSRTVRERVRVLSDSGLTCMEIMGRIGSGD